MSKEVTDILNKEALTPDKELLAMQKEAMVLELEAKKLEVLEKKANLQDIEERLAERELKRETKRQRSLTNGQTLRQLSDEDNAAQKRCNHRKGGNGAAGVIAGQGDDSNFAVLKHIFANGDMWVRCLRCGKTWKPEPKDKFASEEAYLKKHAEYVAACNFQTRNITSAAVQFRFSDNGEYYRKVTSNTSLSKHYTG